MPALLPGYEYDIFISYRQKDNKYDGWVTEFVSNLKKELEATFKEDISIYFDSNPHDGLQETHDVDDSLREKLKCLIFIPVISQTYCDPKSFAWKNEFLAFRDLAVSDPFGLKVKLGNGNVASRILPVRIHDLTASDQRLIEQEIGPLRGIEFIFRAMGVNRPLSPTDNPEKNLNQTFYRDQTNKVANTAREIITSLLTHGSENEAKPVEPGPDRTQKLKSFLKKLARREETSGNSRKVARALVAGLLILAAAWGWWKALVPGRVDIQPVYSFIPTDEPNPAFPDEQPNFAISPDGRSIVYVQSQGIYVQHLGDFTSRLLKGTDRSTDFFSSASNPSFSANGQSIVFSHNSAIKRYDLRTGIITDVVATVASSMFWGANNTIYFDYGLGSRGIWGVPDSGGNPERVTQVIDSLGEVAHRWPQYHPGSRTLVFTAVGPSGGSEDSRVVGQRLGTRNHVTLVDKAIFGRLLSNGKLLYATNDGNVFVVPFDQEELKTTGAPTTVLSDVQTATWGGAAFLSVSETGNLVYIPRNQRPNYSLIIKDEAGDTDGNTKFIDSLLSKQAGHAWKYFMVSPNGLSALVNSVSYGQYDIWQMDVTTGNAERLTFEIAEDETPVWSPKGTYFAYSSANTGSSRRIYIRSASGGSDPLRVTNWPRHIHITSWSPDSMYLAAYEFGIPSFDVWAISVSGKDSIAVANSKWDESEPVFSPDGNWLAYQSNESGENEVYVKSFPDLQVKKQISIGGGKLPRWGSGQKSIYFFQGNKLVRQELDTRNGLSKGKISILFEVPVLTYTVSPDGKKFYIQDLNRTKDHPPLRLITNWFEDIAQKSDR
jgi:Tol biopolymer transport system component